ncbi:hypothetical protein CPY51_16830 [Rhizobium tubonense]|uniref:Uncharacterized protein n=1 Tax=Rhizobium tubonense TaxID=484088 RepID=A0A2W4EFX1_9HYPH|nr:hypothetical protein CPY51_16830 [Rhizobium tubonense]
MFKVSFFGLRPFTIAGQPLDFFTFRLEQSQSPVVVSFDQVPAMQSMVQSLPKSCDSFTAA